MRTDNFRRQHTDLLAVAGELGKHLNVTELSADPKPAAALLSKLSGKLQVHLAMEDDTLYPHLLEHSDSQVRSTAQRFISEMKGIASAYQAYASRWGAPKKIQADPAGFIKETQGIFQALTQRIDKENNDLYDLVDSKVAV